MSIRLAYEEGCHPSTQVSNINPIGVARGGRQAAATEALRGGVKGAPSAGCAVGLAACGCNACREGCKSQTVHPGVLQATSRVLLQVTMCCDVVTLNGMDQIP